MPDSLIKNSETSIHQALKTIYQTDETIQKEASISVNGHKFRLDLLDEEKDILYEIQRTSFGGRFSQKIQFLLDSTDYRIRIIHPIVYKQKITRLMKQKQISVSYRNYGTNIFHFFENLVRFKVPYHNRLEFDILLIYEHQIKEFIGFTKRTGRRRFQTVDRKLVKIIDRVEFRGYEDFFDLLPEDLPNKFTNRDLASCMRLENANRRRKRIPGLITYSLCKLGLLKRVGKQGNAHVFQKLDLT